MPVVIVSVISSEVNFQMKIYKPTFLVISKYSIITNLMVQLLKNI